MSGLRSGCNVTLSLATPSKYGNDDVTNDDRFCEFVNSGSTFSPDLDLNDTWTGGRSLNPSTKNAVCIGGSNMSLNCPYVSGRKTAVGEVVIAL